MFTEPPATGATALALPDNLETTEISAPGLRALPAAYSVHQLAHHESPAGSILPEALVSSPRVGVT